MRTAVIFKSSNTSENNRVRGYGEPRALGLFSRFSPGILYPAPWEMASPQLSRHSPALPQRHRLCSTQQLRFPQARLCRTPSHPPRDTCPGPTWSHSHDHCQNAQTQLSPNNMPSSKPRSASEPGLCTSSPSPQSAQRT